MVGIEDGVEDGIIDKEKGTEFLEFENFAGTGGNCQLTQQKA